MGAQVAQEPSMEEILASIRRIISKDDGSVPDGDSGLTDVNIQKNVGPQGQKSGLSRGDSPVESLSAFNSSDWLMQGGGVDSDVLSKEVSTETVSTSERSETDGNAFQEWGVPTGKEKVLPDPKQGFVGFQDKKNAVLAPGLRKSESEMNDLGNHDFSLTEKNRMISKSESGFFETDHFSVGDDKQRNVEFGKELVSPQTNNSVMESFEQLKHLATDNLDDKVITLLKPMLREWLDNNLPSMVERLVRNEIERVSRSE